MLLEKVQCTQLTQTKRIQQNCEMEKTSIFKLAST